MSYAFARCSKIKNMAGLVAAERHARRQDNSKHIEADRTPLNRASGYPGCDDPLSIVEAFKARKKDAGASERKGASVALHMILGVSPEWVAVTGDVHDPSNPRNVAVFDSAKKFMEDKFGVGSVIHTRLDVDEAGAGVVDVIVVPVTEYQQRGKTKKQVSANAGLEAAFGRGRNFRRLQDQWAEHCRATLDSGIERGRSREETGRDHVHHSVFRSVAADAETILEGARRQADEIKRQAVEQWSDVSDWPWRDREKVVAVAREVGAKEGAAVVRKKAIAALSAVKAKAEKEKVEAVEAKDKEWSVKVSAVESEVESVRVNLGAVSEERDALALEVDALRSENERLKTEVSGLKRTVSRAVELFSKIAKVAPEPVRKMIARFFEPDRDKKDSSPSSPQAPVQHGKNTLVP